MPQVSGAAGGRRRRRPGRPGPAAADGGRSAGPAARRPGDVHRGRAGRPRDGSRCGWRWPGFEVDRRRSARPRCSWLCRGPAHRIIARFGPRLGLTEARLRQRGRPSPRPAAAPGWRSGAPLPGLRTLTVVAAGASGLSRPARAARAHPGQQRVPPGPPGSGPAPRPAGRPGVRPGQGAGPGRRPPCWPSRRWLFWRARRRQQAGRRWMKPGCPACIAVNLLAGRVPAVAELTGPEPASPIRTTRRGTGQLPPPGTGPPRWWSIKMVKGLRSLTRRPTGIRLPASTVILIIADQNLLFPAGSSPRLWAL